MDDIRSAYQFSQLQQLAEVYQQSQHVLCTEEDFFDLAMAYLNRARAQNVRHAEISFSPQGHISRGVTVNTVIGGILTALSLAKMQFGMTTSLIMNFSSQQSEDTAHDILHQAEPWLEQIEGICLSVESAGHSPTNCTHLFTLAHDRNLKCVVQFSRGSSNTQINEALEQLHVDRIGCGWHVPLDDTLVERLVRHEIPLTICPLSSEQKGAVDKTPPYPLKSMLDRQILVSINSNAPSFLGGYVMDNFKATIEASEFTFGDIKRLAKNSFDGSFLPEGQKRAQIAAVDLI